MGVPRITRSFASRQIYPGETWEVYLQASDPDGDMKTIYCTVEQPGMEAYPISLLRVPEDQQRELSGFLYLNTAGVQGLDFATLVLRVEIRDRAGKMSEPVFFPLTFHPRAQQEKPPAGAFQDRELGPIMITLRPGPAGL